VERHGLPGPVKKRRAIRTEIRADVWRGRAARSVPSAGSPVCSRSLKCALQEKSSGSVTNRLEMGFGGTYSGSQESHSYCLASRDGPNPLGPH
jgi:hypothetical protein